MASMAVHPADAVLFLILITANLGLGLYFAFFKNRRLATTTRELFLGSRSLQMVPLALSTMASMCSALGIIGFSAHYYSYGLHMVWSMVATLCMLPFFAHVLFPILYKLQVTSVFEYLRMRYGNGIGVTSCLVYFFITQTYGAIALFAASTAVSTIFNVPLLWTILTMGTTATIYTALGGLRGVVWTDTMQAFLIILTPILVVSKIAYDARRDVTTLRPLWDMDVRKYIFDTSFNFTDDENVWSCLIGMSSMGLYRSFIDQMLVQRYLAARTLKDAKRTIYLGTILGMLVSVLCVVLGVALIYWFRDCDPMLAGAIRSRDQIVPFYVVQSLTDLPGFSGIFLAGVVGATTSTVSSLINSEATIFYVDILSLFTSLPDRRAAIVTKLVGMAAGTAMSVYAIAVPYMGSATRVLLVIQNALTGPFVGLFLAAVLLPWCNSKGVGVATLLTICFQLWLTFTKLYHGIHPERMPVSLDHCPANSSYAVLSGNGSAALHMIHSKPEPFSLTQLSTNWSSLFATLITIALGLALSWATGGHKDYRKQLRLTSDSARTFWTKMKLVDNVNTGISHAERERENNTATLLKPKRFELEKLKEKNSTNPITSGYSVGETEA